MSYVGNPVQSFAFLTDQFSGTGAQTAFTMSVAPANPASIIVAIHGVVQDPSTYAITGTTLNFTQAPPSGTGNISIRYLGVPAAGVTTTAYRTITEFTATAGQTVFTPPVYTVGFIEVYRNGIRLHGTDYTATDGTTVTLAVACTSGDSVAIVTFYVSSVLNAIPATPGSVISSYIVANPSITGNLTTTGRLQANNGLYSSNTFSGTYTDGIVADYTTGMGRISVGPADGLTIYNGGVANTALVTVDTGGNVGVNTQTPGTYGKMAVSTATDKDGLAIVYTTGPVGTNGSAINFWNSHNTAIYKASSIQSIVTNGGSNGSAALTFNTTNNGTLSESMRIDALGRVTRTNQPACFAYHSTTGTLTSGSTWTFDSTYINVSSSYSTSTGRFTAPIAGVYFCSAWLRYNNNSNTYVQTFITINGSLNAGGPYKNSTTSGAQYNTPNVSCILNLAAGDYVQVYAAFSGGTGAFSGYESGFVVYLL